MCWFLACYGSFAKHRSESGARAERERNATDEMRCKHTEY